MTKTKFVQPPFLQQQIFLLVNDCDVVGIDEAQFFDDEIVQVTCNDLANRGIRVIVAGLTWTSKEILLGLCRI